MGVNHVFKIVLFAVAAAIVLAGIPSQATIMHIPQNHASGSLLLARNGSGVSVVPELRVLTDRYGSSLTEFGLGIDLHAEGMPMSNDALVQDAIDTFSRMPPGAGGGVTKPDNPGVIALYSGLPADKSEASSRPEPVSLALVALGLLGISAGIRKYSSSLARERT